MTREQLQRIAHAVGERSGWDFSRVRDHRDPVPWEYLEVAQRYLRPDCRVLDVGTGGGERFLALAPYFGSGLGVDASEEMVATARANTPASLSDKVTFLPMRAEQLDLEPASFDVVLNRHAPVCPEEVVRVLKPGGVFVTQQVGPRNTENICRAFGCGPGGDYATDPSPDLSHLRERFRQLGCEVEAWGEYDVAYRFLDLESFVFWLKAIPMPEDFSPDRHWEQVAHIVGTYGGPAGVVTNEHRLLLVARKRLGSSTRR